MKEAKQLEIEFPDPQLFHVPSRFYFNDWKKFLNSKPKKSWLKKFASKLNGMRIYFLRLVKKTTVSR